MEAQELIRILESEYWGTVAANPEWDKPLWDYLIDRGVEPNDIWGYSWEIGHMADQPWPDWL